jgi:hypothetical protein
MCYFTALHDCDIVTQEDRLCQVSSVQDSGGKESNSSSYSNGHNIIAMIVRLAGRTV